MSANNLEQSAAVALVALATYQLWQAWQNVAPSLSDLRATSRDRTDADNLAMRQRLLDADLTVGSLAALVGFAMLAYTKDWSALLLMTISFGALSFWYHGILASTPR